MKLTTISYCKILTILLAFLFIQEAGAQKIQKDISRSYKMSGNAGLEIENYNCDLDIHTWKESTVKIDMMIIATMSGEEDAKILSRYLDEMEFKRGSTGLHINTRFWKSRISRGNKATTMELENGEKVKYRDFQMKAELWIPEKVTLELRSKYSIINLEDLGGNVDLNLYNDKVYAHSVGGTLNITSKYTTFEFTELHKLKANLYNGELEAASSTLTEIESKYSKIAITRTGDLDLDSYSDKFRFGSTGNINFRNKYSDLDVGKAGDIVVAGYSTTLLAAGAGKVNISSKYGKYDLGNATLIKVGSSYSDKIKVGEANRLEVKDSRYGAFEISRISGHIGLENGYSDKIVAKECLAGFKGMKINGKYLVANLKLDPEMAFSLSAEVKYPDFKIPDGWLKTQKEIRDGSQMELEATKGSPSETDARLDIKGYNVKLILE